MSTQATSIKTSTLLQVHTAATFSPTQILKPSHTSIHPAASPTSRCSHQCSHPASRIPGPGRLPVVLQMLHDDSIPEQDHLHALRASPFATREDRGLQAAMSAFRMARGEDTLSRWNKYFNVYQ